MGRSSWPGGSHGELAAETYVWLSGTHTRTRRPERWFDAVVLSELWRARQSAARAFWSTGMGLLRGLGSAMTVTGATAAVTPTGEAAAPMGKSRCSGPAQPPANTSSTRLCRCASSETTSSRELSHEVTPSPASAIRSAPVPRFCRCQSPSSHQCPSTLPAEASANTSRCRNERASAATCAGLSAKPPGPLPLLAQPCQRVPSNQYCTSDPDEFTAKMSSRRAAQLAMLGTNAPPGPAASLCGPVQVEPDCHQWTSAPVTSSRAPTAMRPNPHDTAAGELTGWPPGARPRSTQPRQPLS